MNARVDKSDAVVSPLDRLRHLEQQVNDRSGTAPAPVSLGELLPEQGVRFPLHWLPCARSEVQHFAMDASAGQRLMEELAREDRVLIPIHPLSVDRFSDRDLIRSGHISFSASYRTAFYEPEAGGPMFGLYGERRILMLKLHLAEPLPGIPGDRRLTPETLERCVWMSRILEQELREEPLARELSLIPESFGVGSCEGGFLLRVMPDAPLVPVFSLYSRDPGDPEKAPAIVSSVKSVYVDDARAAATEAGEWLARPLMSPVLAGFRRGFSLEMHAQNTLVTLGERQPIDRVYFRDMEGVLLFDRLREESDLPALHRDGGQRQWPSPSQSAQRLFNRNIDHDLKRIFDGVLGAMGKAGYFRHDDLAIARKSIRRVSNALIVESGLDHFGRAGRLWPVSRAPWGNGMRLGHYFRTRYR